MNQRARDRYYIVSKQDIQGAGWKLERFLEREKAGRHGHFTDTGRRGKEQGQGYYA